MITDKIQNLFNFIDFLHSNIENFKKYQTIIDKLLLLDIERNNLKPENNYKQKLKYNEVQNELEQKFNIINIIQKIKSKTSELNICDWNKTETIWNYNISDIRKLKENFTNEDIEIITKQKLKYFEFRETTNCNYFQDFFFNNLDKLLKELFDYFKETDKNEFDKFEQKTVKVDSMVEAIQLFKKDNKSFEIELNTNKASIKEPQPKETNKPDEVNENKHIEIFKNDSGYNIFLELHNIYKNKHNQQANYSFLFYALKKDYLVCSGASFINFLSKLNVHIDKIDSRQSGTNSKTELYNSIQKKYSEIQ